MNELDDLLAAVDRDAARDRHTLWLTANEGLMSRSAARYLDSDFANRYFSGGGDADAVVTNPYTPFMSRGRPGLARLVATAGWRAARMLDAAAVNLDCLSGIHAMTCAILALTDPGDTVMSLEVGDGGHYATQHIVRRCGRRWVPAPVDPETWLVDTGRLRADGVRLLYLDGSYELRPQDVRAIRRALGPDVRLVYDISHSLGLVMGGALPSPLSLGADAVCGNTHKTLPGPHRGLIAYREKDLAVHADGIIGGGLYSSNHPVTLAALCVTILEIDRWGKALARQTVANARHLAAALADRGWPVRQTGPGTHTDTHQVHVLSESLGEHRLLYGRFSASNIALGFDNCLGRRTFIRLGTQEVTRRGMTGQHLDAIADLLFAAGSGRDVSAEVARIALGHQRVHFSFDCSTDQECAQCQ
ncbi:hypothetical protein ABT369_50420 [Dactylosporangium sp. NPDC000244]|uniref:hypothetical protein n=1 Tax=Dactylosporangium sp. NPDC000244 TaxID=3154365 RepID=UPI00332EEB3C